MPKIQSVVSIIYKSQITGDDNLDLHDVMEYSEIPDCMIKFDSEVGLHFLFFIQRVHFQPFSFKT